MSHILNISSSSFNAASIYDSATDSNDSFHSTSMPLDTLLESKFSTAPKNFNVIHINSQSIPAHYPDLLSSLNVKNIHAILVSETFLKPCLPSTSYSIPGFHLIRNDRIDKGGGGVAIYLRSHIPFTILDKSNTQNSEAAEHIFVEIQLGTLKILLGVFYSPSLHVNYFQSFETLLEKYVHTVDHTILMGDFNTCIIKNDKRAKSLKNIIESSNLHLLPSSATHFFPHCSPSLLDLIIVSSLNHVNLHGQFPAEAFSYHDLIYLSYKIKPPKLKPTVVMRRNFKNFDNNKFLYDLNLIDWTSVFAASTVDLKMEIFNSILVELFDIHAPLRPVKLKHLPAPWLTQEIRALMTRRNNAKSKYKHNPSDVNLSKYKRLRNACNKLCRDAQRNYIHQSLDAKDSGKTWQFLKSMGIGRQTKETHHSIDFDSLNRHFASTAVNIPYKLNTVYDLKSRPKRNATVLEFDEISEDDIKKNIKAIHSDAIGSDGISRKMLTLSLHTILPVLCHILNNSLSSCTFPKVWRSSHVIPIPKISSPSSYSHFRPISILPFLSKVLERIIHQQLTQYLAKNNTLSQFQSGFRPGHSTTTALIKVCDDIRCGIDNKQVTVLVLLDFSNAFNTVDFDILLAILEHINISNNAIKWFHSYLHNRQQSVRYNNNITTPRCLEVGVPQGGVLSPLLFSIFINSLTDLLNVPFHLYADDLQIYVSSPVEAISEAIERINRNLQIIFEWSKSYGLNLNPTKSQTIIIGTQKQVAKLNITHLPPVMYDCTPISYTKSVKNLGIIMDNTLSWTPHVSNISRKIFATMGSLRRWKNFLPIKTKISLATSLLLPIIDYADSCCLDLSQVHLDKLERLQNLCIRYIFNLRKFDRISSYRNKLQWLTVRHRRYFHVLCTLYSILFHPNTPHYLKERFAFLGSDTPLHINLRSKSDNKLKVPMCNTVGFNDSFTVKSVFLWNDLPSSIRHCKSVHVFKKSLKQYYLAKQNNI